MANQLQILIVSSVAEDISRKSLLALYVSKGINQWKQLSIYHTMELYY